MQAKLLQALKCKPTAAFPDGIKPKGTLIDHLQAYILVRMGAADSVDDECREKTGYSEEQLAKAKHAYRRLHAGIWPEDFAAFDQGIIAGYNPDGTMKPGPNYVENYELEEEEDDEPEDDEEEYEDV